MRKLLLLLLAVSSAFMLVACRDDEKTGGFTELNPDTKGQLDILVWAGQGIFYEDIGKQTIAPEELNSQNTAAIYAMAKKFNETYKNVKINVLAVATGDANWDQQRENYRDEHGKYPDIFAVADLPGDVAKGLVADLSIYSDDPLYKSFNPAIMKMMNYYGVQAGLPQFLVPHGVFVNRALAEQKNIDAPSPDWTIDDYADFISQADKKTFWGAQDVPMNFFFTGSTTLIKQVAEHSGNGPRINLNSAEVKELLKYVTPFAKNSVSPINDLISNSDEKISPTGYDLFKAGQLLTYADTPWLLGDAAHPDPTHWGYINSSDWDYYPRPSTDYMGNTVGIVNDPIAIYNYAQLDGNPEYSETEKAQLDLAYAFASYWVGSDEALQARTDQLWLDGTTLKTAVNDSLPLVTGEAFNRQMEIWYSVNIHARYKDANKMPGFHKILEIWQSGKVFDITTKTYPSYYFNDGVRREVLHEWNQIWDPGVVSGTPGAEFPRRTDTEWYNIVISKLSEWNLEINQRYVQAFDELKKGLITYYQKAESDF